MKILNKTIAWEGRFLRVVNNEFETEAGHKGVWEAVERTNSREIVSIFAVTRDKKLVLTKQFRIPLNNFALELPAVLSDKEGEDLEETARRELLEETGYRADKMIRIQKGPFNSGMSGDVMVAFFAPDVEFVGQDAAPSDDAEEIEVVEVPLSDLVDFCTKEHEGFIIDIKILAKLKILEARGLLS